MILQELTRSGIPGLSGVDSPHLFFACGLDNVPALAELYSASFEEYVSFPLGAHSVVCWGDGISFDIVSDLSLSYCGFVLPRPLITTLLFWEDIECTPYYEHISEDSMLPN